MMTGATTPVEPTNIAASASFAPRFVRLTKLRFLSTCVYPSWRMDGLITPGFPKALLSRWH